jgi:hypothetical protein
VNFFAKFTDVCKRPRAYGLATLGEVMAFLAGMDAMSTPEFLEDFRQWLIIRHELASNLAWELLIIRIAYPAEPHSSWSDIAHHAAGDEGIRVLLNELTKYFAQSVNSIDTAVVVDGTKQLPEG